MSSSSGFRHSGHRRLPPLKQQHQNQQQQQQHQQQPIITVNGSKTKVIDGDTNNNSGLGNMTNRTGHPTHFQNHINNNNNSTNGYITTNGIGSSNNINAIRLTATSPFSHDPGSNHTGYAITAVSSATSAYVLSPQSSSATLTQPTTKMRGRKTSPRLRYQQQLQLQQQHHHRSSFPRTPGLLGADLSSPELTPDVVSRYLRQNPEVLDQFVSAHVSSERIEKWLNRKSSRSQSQHTGAKGKEPATTNGEQQSERQNRALHRWKVRLQSSKAKVLRELSKDIDQTNGRLLVLVELADCVAAAISAESHTIYVIDNENQELTHISRGVGDEIVLGAKERVGLGTSLAAAVAYSKQPTRLRDLLNDRRHPDGLTVSNNKAQSVMALPIVDEQDKCIGVVEMYRFGRLSHFTEEEEEVASLLLQWHDMLHEYVQVASLLLVLGCTVLIKMETHNSMQRQRTLSDFLLEVTKSIFQDIVSMDVVIIKIMNFAKALVHADRTSLFLLDTRSNELYARIFDDGYSLDEYTFNIASAHGSSSQSSQEKGESSGTGEKENNENPDGNEDEKKVERKKHDWQPEDIRFAMNKGVAGYVASTGKILNIRDAYKDKYFNPEVDIRTGYRTKTILCMPIFIRGVVIGVVQMVNKLQGTFTKADEEAFEMFAVYCGLALHHAKLYEKIRRSEQKYKVALDVLSYHSQCTKEEFENLQKKHIPETIPKITNFDFSPWAVEGENKCVYVLYMFRNLFQGMTHNENKKRYDLNDLMRFTLTVRKNYRNVPYHNWTHAFSVAHGMYTVIKSAKHELTPLETVSLFVACLCHDLDHRGKTNAFMVQSASPLAAIYTTSTMEHHHFNQTVTILQNEGHNILKYLTSEEYKQVLGDIKASILATDLAVFFKNKASLDEILKKQKFNWDDMTHRQLLTGLMMTGCDLCAMFKPWDTQRQLVYIIMEEFWQQGDEEKKRGLTPMQMMDRDKKDELPSLEVGFIQTICVPCYELLANIMPDTQPMLDGAQANLAKWKALADGKTLEEEQT